MQSRTESRIAANALELIGNTPLVRLERVTPAGHAEVLGKVEARNPGGSPRMLNWPMCSSSALFSLWCTR